jgi:predicted acetyltransferase
MMRQHLRETHDEGLPLSALYAANHALYRGVGYESAGSRLVIAITPDRIGITERGGSIRPLHEADDATRRALYRRVATHRPGHLDREAGLWRRATHNRDDQRLEAWLLLDDGGEPAGYVTLERRGGAVIQQVLGVVDLVATSTWALRRLLCFLGDFASVVGEIQVVTGPGDPLQLVLAEPRMKVLEYSVMLLRVVSLVPALEGRSWPVAAAGRVELEVEDSLLPGNAGRWVLEVAGGAARVSRGGDGAIRVGPGGLAALYSGYLSPHAATQAGLLEGPEDQLAVLGGLLAGPTPWVMDAF